MLNISSINYEFVNINILINNNKFEGELYVNPNTISMITFEEIRQHIFRITIECQNNILIEISPSHSDNPSVNDIEDVETYIKELKKLLQI